MGPSSSRGARGHRSSADHGPSSARAPDRIDAEAPEQKARALESEIGEIRARLDRSLAELDRRRHELLDVRLQVSRHPAAAVIAGFAMVAGLGGLTYAVVRARRQRPATVPVRLRRALRRMIEEPEKVVKGEPSLPEKILAAVGTTAATILTKKMIEWALDRAARRPGGQPA